MAFFFSGYSFEVAALSEKATRGTSYADFTAYVATNGGLVDPAAAADAIYGYFETNNEELLPFLQIEAEYINERHALVSVTLNSVKLDPVNFSTTGATTHLNQSLSTRGTYAAPGKQAPNYQGAIGVSDSGVDGVDVTVPAFEFTLKRKFKYTSTAYLLACVALTGKTNSSPWQIFATGEALFLGAEGGENDQNWVDITYHFAARPNENNLSVGNITGVNKRGWEYLWVKHDEEVVADRVLQRPAAAYVEQVYPQASFATLGV